MLQRTPPWSRIIFLRFDDCYPTCLHRIPESFFHFRNYVSKIRIPRPSLPDTQLNAVKVIANIYILQSGLRSALLQLSVDVFCDDCPGSVSLIAQLGSEFRHIAPMLNPLKCAANFSRLRMEYVFCN